MGYVLSKLCAAFISYNAWGLTGVEKLLAVVVAYVDRRLTPRLTYPLLECRRIENLCLVEARFNQVHGYLEVA